MCIDIEQISSSVDIMISDLPNVMEDVRDRDIAPDSVGKPKQNNVRKGSYCRTMRVNSAIPNTIMAQ
jgi:hypothetical protein